jgi:MerR family copper efflux transcriptional regulator
MNIGAAAKHTGVSAKTIRYYERVGLLPRPSRTTAGYRVYGEQELAMLGFVRRARALGFAVRDVASLLALWRDRQRSNAAVKGLAQRHVADIDAKIAEYRAIRHTLVDLIERCHGDGRPDCPILDTLEASSEKKPKRPKR